jgi:predicted XRE-type DNA-binding protein
MSGGREIALDSDRHRDWVEVGRAMGGSGTPVASNFCSASGRRRGRPAEALAKAELARKIGTLITKRGLTQAAAAELLKVDQPKVSALVRGRLAGFSLDRLVRFLVLLGSDVEIVVKPRTRAAGRAKVLVA